MSEPTEYPYRGMSEGFAGDWVDESDATTAQAPAPVESAPAPAPAPIQPAPVPPVPPYAAGPGPLVDAGYPSLREGESGGGVSDRLSALLQTAVDEQVQEQRHLTQLMLELRAGLDQRAAGGAEELRTVIEGAVGSAVNQLNENFDSGLRSLRQQHDEQIAELNQRLADAQNELRELHRLAADTSAVPYQDTGAVGDLVDGLAGMRTELRVLPEQVAPFVAQALAPSMSEIGRVLGTVEEAQLASSQDSAAVRQDLAALLPRLEVVPDQIAMLASQVSSLTAAQAAFASAQPIAAGPDAHEIADIVRKGVRDATRDFVRDYLRDAVRDIVTVSTRDTERRITDHVDEAVLALAQALLTRRPAIVAGEYAVAPTPMQAQMLTPPTAEPEPAAPAPVPDPVESAEPVSDAQVSEVSEVAENPEISEIDVLVAAADVETPADELAETAPVVPPVAPEPPAAEPPAAEPAAAEPPATHRRRGLFRRR